MWLPLTLLFIVHVQTALSQRSCITPNGDTALCIHLQYCQLFYDYVQKSYRDPETTRYVSESRCGVAKDGFPLVCCGNEITFRRQSTLPSRNECGFQDSYKVLGGKNADLSEFPWTALLQKIKASGQKAWDCGGSLINNRYVLTAAHCVASPVTLVRVGEWNVESDEDCVGLDNHRSCSLPPQDRQVERTISHPQYARTKQGISNDIALLRLSSPVTFNKFVQPICLPLAHEKSRIGQYSHVTGWGASSIWKSYSAIKQKLKIPIVHLQVCRDRYPLIGPYLNNKIICAGGEEGKDACKGDSGGPLLSTASGNSQQYYIEGIVSIGPIECGKKGYPAMYTRVSDFLGWIRENVKP